MKTAQDFLAAAAGSFVAVDSQQAQDLLQQNAPVLDVREPFEFEAGHVPQAINVPRGVIEFMLPNHPAFANLDKNTPILVYCKTSGRSILAAKTLNEMGYSQLFVLTGGFDAWQGEVNKIERDPAVFNQ